MCGISLLLCGQHAQDGGMQQNQAVEQELASIKALLARRGPDWLGHVQVPSGHCQLHVLASLLQLRGAQPSTAPLVRLPDSTVVAQCSDSTAVTGKLTADTQPAATTTGPAAYEDVAPAANTWTQEPTSSPVLDAQAVLAYNGELFGGLEVQQGQNDGQLLFHALCAAPLNQGEEAGRQHVTQVMSRLRGPWAVVFWDAAHETLWFGRDMLGRRSLLLHWPSAHHPHLTLTSIAPSHMQAAQQIVGAGQITPSQQVQQGNEGEDDGGSGAPVPTASTWQPWQAAVARPQSSPWQEVPPGLYSLKRVQQGPAKYGIGADAGTNTKIDVSSITPEPRQFTVAGEVWQFQHHAWADEATQQLADFSRPAHLIHPAGQEGAGPPPAGSVPRNNAAALHKAAKQQQQDPAAGADACKFYGVSEQAVSTVLAALRAAMQVRCSCIEDHAPHSTAVHNSSNGPVSPVPKGVGDLSLAHSLLLSAASAITELPFTHRGDAKDELAPSPLLILFSGGVDSTLLAALAHQCLPPGVPIDLSNVCFDGGKSPDRLAAISAVEELARYAPDREWRLILVDAKLQDMDPLRDHMLTLLHPAGTVMDMNIGSALWLAVGARGKLYIPNSASTVTQPQETQGQHQPAQGRATDALQVQLQNGHDGHVVQHKSCYKQPPTEQTQQQSQWRYNQQADQQGEQPHSSRPEQQHCFRQPVHGGLYCSCARVVIMGHGADEQCAGYGRHRTRYATGGWSTLADELALDVKRLWLRNLGRDDRLVADWGREARHPFLDEQLMLTMLQAVPLPELTNLHDPPGVGDKRILRAALAQLGLPQAAARIKRAIQFGSRIGKASNCRDFGSNRAANKASAGTVHLHQLCAPERRDSLSFISIMLDQPWPQLTQRL